MCAPFPPPPATRRRRSRANRALAVCCSILLGVWSADAVEPTDKTAAVYQTKPGPWGVIEYNYLYIEATEELIANVPQPNSTSNWTFPKASVESLRQLFTRAALPPAMIERLLDKKQMVTQADSITVFPPLEDLEAMTPAMREVVYAQLALSPENEFHYAPVYFIGGKESWLRDTRIRAELKEKIRRMAYRRGKVEAFSDLQALLADARSDLEARRILKLATRVRTIVARVRVTPQTDFNQLYDYWSGQRRARDIRPFLESIAERPSEASLDLIHLMPRRTRALLYSYPTFDLAARGRLPDCHWTSLNFFNLVPKAYYLDTRLASAHVLASYTAVAAPFTFGDVIFFMNATGEAAHSCVYLADDIVYTKNGENVLSPWILMHLADLESLYANEPGWRLQGYRRKPVTN